MICVWFCSFSVQYHITNFRILTKALHVSLCFPTLFISPSRGYLSVFYVLPFHQLSVLHVICPTRLDCVMNGLLDITTTPPSPAVYTSGTAVAMATATTSPQWRSASRHARAIGLSPRHTAAPGAKSGQMLTHLSIPTVAGLSRWCAGQRPEMCRLAALIKGKSAMQEPSAPTKCPLYQPEELDVAHCSQRWPHTFTQSYCAPHNTNTFIHLESGPCSTHIHQSVQDFDEQKCLILLRFL